MSETRSREEMNAASVGTALFTRQSDDSIVVNNSFDEIAEQLLETGEFILVTDPDDGPYLLRTSLIDLAVANTDPQDTAQTTETPAT